MNEDLKRFIAKCEKAHEAKARLTKTILYLAIGAPEKHIIQHIERN